ncbi:MAG: DUF6666 family protein [Thermoguttaceae bacterium]
MRRLHLGTAVLLVVFLSHAAGHVARAQEICGGQLTAARETIKLELAAALAHGELTRMDQYRILMHAKEILPPEDVQGLERTMDRLASKGQSAPAAGTGGHADGAQAKLTAYSTTPDSPPVPAEPAIAPKPGESPGPLLESPFQPVAPGQETAQFMDGEAMFNDYEAGLLGGEGSLKDNLQSVWHQTWSNASFFTAVDAFKGPIDLFVPNGNFGVDFGFNVGIPLSYQWGIGVQAGMNATVTDWQGSFSASNIDQGTSDVRNQMFTTLGLFQRMPFHGHTLLWGFAHDWLQDDYYEKFHFAQWRVKLGIEWGPWNETGLWAAMPDHGYSATVAPGPDQPFTTVDFRPMAQGNMYWKHNWCSGATTTAWVGVAQMPSNFVFGGDARIPIAARLSLIGQFSYVMPRAGGLNGQFDEMWNVMFGLEFVPGGAHRCAQYRFAPALPVADNGNFAIQELLH